MGLTMVDGSYTINDGAGPFKTDKVVCINGGGNPRIPTLKAEAQNLIADPNFAKSSIVEWYISSDTAAITSRTVGSNVNLAKDTATFRTGGDASMKVTKTYGAGSAATIQIVVPIKSGKLAMYELYMKGTSLTGNIYVTAFHCSRAYNTSIGTPVSARTVQFGPSKTIDSSTLTDWVRVAQSTRRDYTPEWATHMIIEINMVSMKNGDLYIDDVRATEL